MSFQVPSDLQQSISAYIAKGIYPNEEAVLRDALRLLNERQEDLDSIQRGLDNISDGNTRIAEESNEAFRRRHNIPSDS